MTSVAGFFRGCLVHVFVGLASPVIASLVMLALASAAHADTATVLPFQDLTTATAAGHIVVPVPPGSQANALKSFDTTGFLESTTVDATLAPASGDPFDPSNPSTKLLLLPALAAADFSYQDMPGIYVTYSYINEGVIAEVLLGSVAGYTLYLGLDTNGDGLPQAGETLCTSTSTASSPARCVYRPADQAHAGFGSRFWALMQAPAGSPKQVFGATLSGGINYYSGQTFPWSPGPSRYADTSGGTVTLGPGYAPAGSAFSLRTSWLFPLQAHKRYYSALLMGSGNSLLGDIDTVLPFALTYTAEQADAQSAILLGPDGGLGGQVSLAVEPGQTLHRVFFDLPPADRYNPIAIYIVPRPYSVQSTLNDVNVYAARADFPAASDSPVIAPAPSSADANIMWNAGATSGGTIVSPSAGRWYVVISNSGTTPVTLGVGVGTRIDDSPGSGTPEMQSALFGASANPTLAEGAYFNLKRGGHGIFLSRGYNQQVVDWYTFLEDGTPVFYVAQATAPPSNSGWWSAPLYRAAWDPVQRGFTTKIAGAISLAPTAENQMMFSWHLEGQSGSEAFTLLARTGACPTVKGSVTNFKGTWFSSGDSGYGVDVLALPEQQFDTFYLYDSRGNPTWVIGANGPFSASSTLDLVQSTGFCPACAWQPLTTRPAGSLTIGYTDPMHGQFSTAITLSPPLSGTWNVNRPTWRLTGSPACQ